MKLTILAWLMAASLLTVYFSWLGIVRLVDLRYLLAGVNLLLLLIIGYELFIPRKINFRLIFLAGNLYIFIVFSFLIADKI